MEYRDRAWPLYGTRGHVVLAKFAKVALQPNVSNGRLAPRVLRLKLETPQGHAISTEDPMSISRRTALISAAAAAPALNIGTAMAAAPKVGRQVPGFFRFNIGDFEITSLNDGQNNFEVGPARYPNTRQRRSSRFWTRSSRPLSLGSRPSIPQS